MIFFTSVNNSSLFPLFILKIFFFVSCPDAHKYAYMFVLFSLLLIILPLWDVPGFFAQLYPFTYASPCVPNVLSFIYLLFAFVSFLNLIIMVAVNHLHTTTGMHCYFLSLKIFYLSN